MWENREVRLPEPLRLIAITMALAGCAGRAPQPVAAVQPQDVLMDCTAIAADVKANDKKLKELASEEGAKVAQNVAAGMAGLLIWPLWFGMDFQGAASTEATALQSRQEYLGTLAEQKSCGMPRAIASPYAQPATAGTAPAVPRAPAASSMPTATGLLGPSRVVLFPVTIYNPYYPPSVFVDVQ
jgi:hypothetical protein